MIEINAEKKRFSQISGFLKQTFCQPKILESLFV